jgi:hypothetical protein
VGQSSVVSRQNESVSFHCGPASLIRAHERFSRFCFDIGGSFVLAQGNSPVNDRCVNATQLELSHPIDGNNINANFDFFNQAVCGRKSDGSAVWYAIRGNGNRYELSICSHTMENVDFGLFEACNSQTCFGFPIAESSGVPIIASTEIQLCEQGQAAKYYWNTADGQNYYIHVRGYIDISFRLSVKDESEDAPFNDDCDEAIQLRVGSIVDSSTAGASYDFLLPECGKYSDRAGIWYSIIGDGLEYTASICTKNEVLVDMGVFSECNDRESCIAFSQSVLALCKDDDILTINWSTVAGTEYYIHIRGVKEASFLLRMTAGSVKPNNKCDGAQSVVIGTPIIGNNIGATFDFSNKDSCGPKSDQAGVWYLVTGDGYKLTASLCSSNAVDTFFGMFADCDTLECIGFSKESGLARCQENETLTFSFDTFIGEDYLIHIRAAVDSNFTLPVAHSGGTKHVFGIAFVLLSTVTVWSLCF